MKKFYVSLIFCFFQNFAAYANPIGFCSQLFQSFDSKQYSNTDVSRKYFNKFVSDRDLQANVNLIGEKFINELALLGPEQVYVEFGSGEGAALFDYHQSWENLKPQVRQYLSARQDTSSRALMTIYKKSAGDKALTIGITYSNFHLLQKIKLNDYGKIKVLADRYFEEIDPLEIPKFDLASDPYGIFFYTRNLDDYFLKVFSRMKLGGKLFLGGSNQSSVKTSDGQQLHLFLWLSRIQGVEIHQSREGFWIEKKSDLVRWPQVELVSYEPSNTGASRVWVETGKVSESI